MLQDHADMCFRSSDSCVRCLLGASCQEVQQTCCICFCCLMCCATCLMLRHSRCTLDVLGQGISRSQCLAAVSSGSPAACGPSMAVCRPLCCAPAAIGVHVSLVHVVTFQHVVLILLSEDGTYGVRVHPTAHGTRSGTQDHTWLQRSSSNC